MRGSLSCPLNILQHQGLYKQYNRNLLHPNSSSMARGLLKCLSLEGDGLIVTSSHFSEYPRPSHLWGLAALPEPSRYAEVSVHRNALTDGGGDRGAAVRQTLLTRFVSSLQIQSQHVSLSEHCTHHGLQNCSVEHMESYKKIQHISAFQVMTLLHHC